MAGEYATDDAAGLDGGLRRAGLLAVGAVLANFDARGPALRHRVCRRRRRTVVAAKSTRHRGPPRLAGPGRGRGADPGHLVLGRRPAVVGGVSTADLEGKVGAVRRRGGHRCALYGEAILLYAPFPNFMHDVLKRAAESPSSAVVLVVLHTLKGAGHYLAPTRDNLVQVGLRYQTLLIAGAAAYHVRARIRREGQATVQAPANEQSFQRNSSTWRMPRLVAVQQISAVDLAFGFVLLNLLCIVGFVTAFYDVFDWRDYRVIAPHLLLSVLVLVGVGARQWLGGYATIALLVGLMIPTQFARFHRERVAVDPTEIAAFASEIEDFVVVKPGAPGWENTILLDIDRLGSPLIAGLPPGIGAAPIYERDEGIFPARSRYVLFTPEEAVRFGAPASLRKLATTALGDLYVQDAAPLNNHVGSASADADAKRAAAVSASAEADRRKIRHVR